MAQVVISLHPPRDKKGKALRFRSLPSDGLMLYSGSKYWPKRFMYLPQRHSQNSTRASVFMGVALQFEARCLSQYLIGFGS